MAAYGIVPHPAFAGGDSEAEPAAIQAPVGGLGTASAEENQRGESLSKRVAGLEHYFTSVDTKRVILVMDLSGSTLAEDQFVEGKRASRLAAEKQIALELIRSHPGVCIGVVGFGSAPFEVSPPCVDPVALQKKVEMLRTGIVEDGSAIGDALVAAIQELREPGIKSRQIVLLTDGNNNSGEFSPAMAAEIARDRGISVVIAGIGTGEEAPFPVLTPQGTPVHDATGNPVYRNEKCPVDTQELKRLAAIAKGQFISGSKQELVNALNAALNKAVVPKELSRSDVDPFIRRFIAPSKGMALLSATAEPQGSLFLLSAKADYKVALLQPSPARFEYLAPGDYLLKVMNPGYKTEERTVAIPVSPSGDAVDLGLIRLSPPPVDSEKQLSAQFAKNLAAPNAGVPSSPSAPAKGNGSSGPISIEAKLSGTTTQVGQELKLSLQIEGTDKAGPAPGINSPDGVEITLKGTESSVNIINSEVKMSTIFHYSVVAKRAGKFVIPPLELTVKGHPLITNALTFRASDGPPPKAEPAQGAFTELKLAKPSAFLGEVIPAEIRLYCDAASQWSIPGMPTLVGDDFRISKLSKGEESLVTKAGHSYRCVMFRANIIPLKPGTHSLKLADLECLQIKNSPRKVTHGSDPFDSFFADVFPPQKAVKIKSSPANTATVTVKPLPTTGQPKSFQGAIGHYRMEARLPRPEAGQPLIAEIKITGTGDFDAVTPPGLTSNSTWQSGMASAAFDADDASGFSGTKRFRISLAPKPGNNSGTTEPLRFEFSFFDPDKAAYVTLHTADLQAGQQ
jgi:hypothetical protein